MIAAACPNACRYHCPYRKGGAGSEDGSKYEEIATAPAPGSAAARATASSDPRGVAGVAVKESVGRGERGLLHAAGRDASPPHAQPYDPEPTQGGDSTATRPRCSGPRTQAIKARPVRVAYVLPPGADLRAREPASVTAPRGSRLGLRCRASCAPAGRACPQLVVHGWSARTIAAVRRLLFKLRGQEARGTAGGAARIHAEAMTGPVAATPRKRAARPDRAEGLTFRALRSERSYTGGGGRRTRRVRHCGQSGPAPLMRRDSDWNWP